MSELTPEELAAIKKALLSDEFKKLIGMAHWDLTEVEEFLLWDAIRKLEV